MNTFSIPILKSSYYWLLLFLWSLSMLTHAQSLPQGITYQGKLIENNSPFTGQATILFELLNPSTNAIVWSETQTVNVQDGLYAVVLGSQTAFASDFFASNPDLQLRVTVNGNTLSPNITLHAVPFAHSTSSVMPNTINSSSIIDGTIQTTDMRSGGRNKILTTNNLGTIIWEDQTTVITSTPTLAQVLNAGTSANNNKITNLDTPTDPNDATNKAYVDAVVGASVQDLTAADASISISNGVYNGTTSETIQVTDGGISTTKLANDAVDRTKIADGEVTNADLEDNAVTTDKIADATIQAQDIAVAGTDEVLYSDGSSISWQPTSSLPITENDPKVGILTDNTVPRWDDTNQKLIDGSILDDGSNVSISVGGEITLSPITGFTVTSGDDIVITSGSDFISFNSLTTQISDDLDVGNNLTVASEFTLNSKMVDDITLSTDVFGSSDTNLVTEAAVSNYVSSQIPTYTFENGLINSLDTIRLGGVLTQPITQIDANNNSFGITDFNIASFSSTQPNSLIKLETDISQIEIGNDVSISSSTASMVMNSDVTFGGNNIIASNTPFAITDDANSKSSFYSEPFDASIGDGIYTTTMYLNNINSSFNIIDNSSSPLTLLQFDKWSSDRYNFTVDLQTTSSASTGGEISFVAQHVNDGSNVFFGGNLVIEGANADIIPQHGGNIKINGGGGSGDKGKVFLQKDGGDVEIGNALESELSVSGWLELPSLNSTLPANLVADFSNKLYSDNAGNLIWSGTPLLTSSNALSAGSGINITSNQIHLGGLLTQNAVLTTNNTTPANLFINGTGSFGVDVEQNSSLQTRRSDDVSSVTTTLMAHNLSSTLNQSNADLNLIAATDGVGSNIANINLAVQKAGITRGMNLSFDDGYVSTIFDSDELIVFNEADETRFSVATFNDSRNPLFILARARGNNTTPNPIVAGDNLGAIHFSGHDGSDFAPSATIFSTATAAPQINGIPSDLSFATSNALTGSLEEKMKINSRGVLFLKKRINNPFGADNSFGRLFIGDSDGDLYYVPADGISTTPVNISAGASTTFTNGIGNVIGGVGLGGNLTQITTINANSFDFEINNFPNLNLSTTSGDLFFSNSSSSIFMDELNQTIQLDANIDIELTATQNIELEATEEVQITLIPDAAFLIQDDNSTPNELFAIRNTTDKNDMTIDLGMYNPGSFSSGGVITMKAQDLDDGNLHEAANFLLEGGSGDSNRGGHAVLNGGNSTGTKGKVYLQQDGGNVEIGDNTFMNTEFLINGFLTLPNLSTLPSPATNRLYADGLGDLYWGNLNLSGGISPWIKDGSDNLYYPTNAGTVGIGDFSLATPNADLHIKREGTGTPANIKLSSARGSVGSPSTLNIGDPIGELIFNGYDGSTFQDVGKIEMVTTASPLEGDMRFQVGGNKKMSISNSAVEVSNTDFVVVNNNDTPSRVNLNLSTLTTGTGGNIHMIAQSVINGGNTRDAAMLTLQGGNTQGGTVNLSAGNASNGNGGDVNLSAGNANATSGNGGDVTILSGDSPSQGGNIKIESGKGNNGGSNGGNLSILGGDGIANGGKITIQGGSGGAGTASVDIQNGGGNVYMGTTIGSSKLNVRTQTGHVNAINAINNISGAGATIRTISGGTNPDAAIEAIGTEGRVAQFYRQNSGSVAILPILEVEERDGDATGTTLNILGGFATSNTLFLKNNNSTGRAILVENSASNTIFELRDNGQAFLVGPTAISSDRRYKTQIQTLNGSLANIQKLRGTNYYWKDLSKDQSLQFGVIAQELEEVFPNLIHTNSEGYKSVNYIGLVPVLIEATKEQQTIIENQQEEIQSQKSEIEVLKQQLSDLKQLVATLQETQATTANTALTQKVEALEKQLSVLIESLGKQAERSTQTASLKEE